MGYLNTKIILAKSVRTIITSFIAIVSLFHAQTSLPASTAYTQQAAQDSSNLSQSIINSGVFSQLKNKQLLSKKKQSQNTSKSGKKRLSRVVTKYLKSARSVLWGHDGWQAHYLRRLAIFASALIGLSITRDAFAARSHNNHEQLQSAIPEPVLPDPELPVVPDTQPAGHLVPVFDKPLDNQSVSDNQVNNENNADIKEEKAESEAERVARIAPEQRERVEEMEALVEERKQRRLQRNHEQDILNAELDAKLLEQQQDAQKKDEERQVRRAVLKEKRDSLPRRFMEAILLNNENGFQEAVRLIEDEPVSGVVTKLQQHIDRCKTIINTSFVNALNKTILNMPGHKKRRTWMGATLPLTVNDALTYVNSELPSILRAIIPVIEKDIPSADLICIHNGETRVPSFVPVNLFKIAVKLKNVVMVDELLENYRDLINRAAARGWPDYSLGGKEDEHSLNLELADFMLKHDCLEMMERVSKRGYKYFVSGDICKTIDNNSLALISWLIDRPDWVYVWDHAVSANNEEIMRLILDRPRIVKLFNEPCVYDPISKSNNVYAMQLLLDKIREYNLQINPAGGCVSLLDSYLFSITKDKARKAMLVNKGAQLTVKMLTNAGVRMSDTLRMSPNDSTIMSLWFADGYSFCPHGMGIAKVLVHNQKTISPWRLFRSLALLDFGGGMEDFIYDGNLDMVSRRQFEAAFEAMLPDMKSRVTADKQRYYEAQRVLVEENTHASMNGEKRKQMPSVVIDIIEGYCRPRNSDSLSDKLQETLPGLSADIRDTIQDYTG